MNSLIVLCGALAALLAGCDETRHPEQALASVNGELITATELNDESRRVRLQPGQQGTPSGQLLETLIDRQLLLKEAIRERLDRDPKVRQALERVRAQIVAEAWLQKKIGAIARPTPTEVSSYYRNHPDFFARRKQFDLHQLVIDTRDLTDQARKAAAGATTLDQMAAWLDAGKVRYVRSQASRTTSELPPGLSAQIRSGVPGQLFVMHDGPRSMLVTLAAVRDHPASLTLAAPQIEAYLMSKRTKDATEAELARLRSSARIEYLDQAMAPLATAAGPK